MTALAVTRVGEWVDIESAAAIEGVKTCIRPEGPNWQRAKETWELHSGGEPAVVYFVVHVPYTTSSLKGYIRFLKVSNSPSITPTWIVDFVRPSQYGIVVMAAAELPGAVLVKKFSADDDAFIRNWPTITVTLPRLDQYPYHAQSSTESIWYLVPKPTVDFPS